MKNVLTFIACIGLIFLTPWGSVRGENDQPDDDEGMSIDLSGEFEFSKQNVKLENRTTDEFVRFHEIDRDAELEVEASVNDWLSGRTVFIAELSEEQSIEIDEAFLDLRFESWNVQLGRQYPAFGKYYNAFILGPIVEFGEVHQTAFQLEFQTHGRWQATGFVFEGDRSVTGGKHHAEWGVGVGYEAADADLEFGIGYLSDLAESESDIIRELDGDQSWRSGAWNTSMSWQPGAFGLSVESLFSARTVPGLEEGYRPRAINVEIVWDYRATVRLGFRVETSRDVPDAPKSRYGLGLSWRASPQLILGADYFYSRYRPGARLEDDVDINRDNITLIQATIEY